MPETSPHRLLVSDDVATRLAALGEWLLEGQKGQQHRQWQETLLLAPSRGAADDFLRRFCPGRGLFGVHRFTLRQLAAELATPAMAARQLAPVSNLGSQALAARCLARCQDAGALDYFVPVLETPGMPLALRRTLLELRLAEVPVDELAETGAPGQDLARLLSTYEDELERWHLADDASLLRLACGQLTEADDSLPVHPLVGRPMLWLDLAPQSTLEQRLLTLLADRCPGLIASQAAGDRRGQQILETLCGVAAEMLSPATSPAAPQSKLQRLRQRIFQPGVEDLQPPADDDDSVAWVSAPGEGRECVEIARRMRQLAAQGLAFDQMAILLRDPTTYLPLVEEALRRAGIPGYFTRGATRPHGAGRAFLSLLACASEGLSARRFAEYLSLGQVPAESTFEAASGSVEVPWVMQDGDQLVFKTLLSIDATAEASPAKDVAEVASQDDQGPIVAGTLRTPRRWERLLVEAAVLGGSERWQRRLRGLTRELRLRLSAMNNDDAAQRQHLERQIEQLDNLERFALPIIERLDDLPSSAPWGEWLQALEELAQSTLREPDKVLTLLAELRPMREVGPVTLDEVRQVLDERLTLLRSEPPARRYARVFVATIDEARGRNFEAVFLPGLAEGIFPRRASEDPLLLDTYRQALGERLITQRDRIDDERLLLRIAAGAAQRQLIVSYPNLDTLAGRARVPSFYALDLLRAAEGTLPDFRLLEDRASSSTASILGWPAPRDPDLAIDDTEYDLSIIEPLLRLPIEQARARGRYLLDSNRHLTRSLRRRYRRWQRRFSSADGVAQADAETLAALAPHRLRQRAYSPTALQHFAACPYRFLLSAVHRLRPRDAIAPLEQLDPLTRGSLFHEVQFELFSSLEKHQLLPMTQDALPQLLELADRTLDAVAERYRDDLAPAIPRVWTSQIESLRNDLRGWIHSVTSAGEAWRPLHFEFAFGLGSRGSASGVETRHAAVILDGKKLRGSIDLVEIDESRGHLRITDHKTGAKPSSERLVIGGGEVLQPLLYALAAEVHLGQAVDSGRLFYCTRKGQYEVRDVPLNDQNRQKVGLVLEVIDRAIGEGMLVAAPRQGACEHCDYRSVCGPLEELRLRRKRPHDEPRLRALASIRQSP